VILDVFVHDYSMVSFLYLVFLSLVETILFYFILLFFYNYKGIEIIIEINIRILNLLKVTLHR